MIYNASNHIRVALYSIKNGHLKKIVACTQDYI